jgi:hypothetical protein
MRERERDSDGRGRVYDGQLSVRQLDELHETLRKLTVGLGLSRIVALHNRAFTLYQIR